MNRPPDHPLVATGRVGVLLGMEPSSLPWHFPMPAGEVRLVTVKALLPGELAYLLEHAVPIGTNVLVATRA